MAAYQLANSRSSNSLGWYDSEDDALRDVARDVQRLGAAKAGADLALYHVIDGGHIEVVSREQDLVHRALERFPRALTA